MREARPRDGSLALLFGAALFALAAAPLCFVKRPPFQDFGEHVAAAAMAAHPGDFPGYVFNGFLKTNSAFVAFTWLAGKAVGFERAGFVFALLVLGVNAFVLPWFVLHFGGRGRMASAVLFAPPFVHNWFVSMGMLNFSLGVSLSMVLLVALDRHRAAPSWPRALGVVGLSFATWYAHPVPVIAVGLLAAVEVLSRPGTAARVAAARSLAPPLAPVAIAVALSTAVHLHGAIRPAASGAATVFQTPLWLVYDLWAHWAYGYTPLSATSLASMAALVALVALGWRRATSPLPLFGSWALLSLLVLYFAAPYQTVGLGYAGSRVLPYLWLAVLLRVPERLTRGWAAMLGTSAALYVAGMAVDEARLARDEDELAAGVDAVGRGARLDVFIFSPRVTSKNTWSLSTAWGDYVVRSHARTWEMPGDTPSLPFRWSEPPPPRLETSAHHRFMDGMRTRSAFCAKREAGGLDAAECERQWRAGWASYYREVDPFIDAILMWDPPDDSLSQVPAGWGLAFRGGKLWIFSRAAGGQAERARG